MHRIIICAMGMILAASCVCAQEAPQVCADSVLPDGVRAALANEYGEWRIETAADLSADYQKAWVAKRPNDCPGITSGHFEGKSEPSYALLLIPRAKAAQGFRLIVMSKARDKGGYSANVLEQDDKTSVNDAAIYRAEPGLQFNEEKFATFKLKSDGIYFEFFEKGGSIYFWKHGRYEHVVESD